MVADRLFFYENHPVLQGELIITKTQCSSIAMQLKMLQAFSIIFLLATITLSGILWYSVNQTNELQSQNDTLKTQLQDMQNQNNQLQSQVNASQNRINELENQTASLQNQIDNLQQKNPSSNVDITELSLGGWSCPGGVQWNKRFNVTVLNNGTNKVDGIAVTFNVVGSEGELDIYSPHSSYSLPFGKPYSLATLNQGENQQIQGVILSNISDASELVGRTFVVTVKLGDAVLAEDSITIKSELGIG